jgi:hypothetical protein
MQMRPVRKLLRHDDHLCLFKSRLEVALVHLRSRLSVV